MHRRWSLLLLFTLLLAACGGIASADDRPTPDSGRNPVNAPPLSTAFPPLTAGQSYAYVVDYSRTIRVIDPQAATIIGELPVGSGALPVFSPDGARLYVTHDGQQGNTGAQFDVFDVRRGRRIAGVSGLELMPYKIWGPSIIAPSRDGHIVYLHGRRTTSQPGEVGRDICWMYAFDVVADRLSSETIPLPTCRVAPLVLSADGRTLYSGPWLVDLTTHPATVRENVALANASIAQSADGRWLYALDQSGMITVWDADARKVARKFPDVVPRYGSFIYLSNDGFNLTYDGTRLVIATDDGDRSQQDYKGVIIVDSTTGQRVSSLHMDHPFRSLTVNPDGAVLYVVTRNTLEIWDAATGMRRATVNGVGESAGPVLAPPSPP